jgi:uncharacterized surface anchored protein
MATVRVFGRESYDPNSKNRYYKNWDALGKVLNYMYRTGGDTENDLIESCRGGYGVNMESVHSIESDMRLVKKVYEKENGRQLRHFSVNLSEEETESVGDLNQLAMEICEYYSEAYQIVYAGHSKDRCVHFHMCMNSVSYIDGKKYTDKNRDLDGLKKHVGTCIDRSKELKNTYSS